MNTLFISLLGSILPVASNDAPVPWQMAQRTVPVQAAVAAAVLQLFATRSLLQATTSTWITSPTGSRPSFLWMRRLRARSNLE